MSSSEHRASHNHSIEPLQIEPFVPVFAAQARASTSLRNKRALRAGLAMALVLLVHAALIVVLLRSPAILTHDLLERGGEAAPPLLVALTIGEDDTERAVAIQDPDLSVRVLNEWTDETPPILEVDDDGVDATTLDAPGGSSAQARYLAQIAARIERAWQSSAGPEGKQSRGRCQAWVTQNADGTVTAIELAGCEPTRIDASTLLAAVQRASPLPSPAEVSLFIADLRVSVDVANGHVDVMPRRAQN